MEIIGGYVYSDHSLDSRD